MSDKDILQTITGDPAGGLAVAIDKYGRQLKGRLIARAAARAYGNANVDDVWQECFLALLDPEKRRTLDERDDPQILPWLTRRGYWGLQQANDPSLQELDDEAAEVAAQNSTSPLLSDPPAPPTKAEIALRQAWAKLTDKDKLLLTWRYGEGWSEAEIAGALGGTLAAAKKALHDARARLRRHMTDLGYES